MDLSTIRGVNYVPAEVNGHADTWLHYNAAIVERDLDYAKRLNVNQIRCFIPYSAWTADKVAFRKNLIHMAQACDQRGIGLMPTLFGMNNAPMIAGDPTTSLEPSPQAIEWVTDLVDILRGQPGLAFWDVSNEPDWPVSATRRAAFKRPKCCRDSSKKSIRKRLRP